jgi:hypothetical protein
LSEWLSQARQKVKAIAGLSKEEKIKIQEEIAVLTLSVLISQVSLQCSEKGALLRHVIGLYQKTMQKILAFHRTQEVEVTERAQNKET